MCPASFSSVRNNPWVITGVVLVATALWIVFFKHSPLSFLTGKYLAEWGISARKLVFFSLLTLIPLLAMFVLHRPKEVFSSWGFSGNFLVAFALSIFCTAPMFIGNALKMPLTNEISNTLFDAGLPLLFEYMVPAHPGWSYQVYWEGVLNTAVIAGFFEEIIFRGFIFGQLFRYARWGFMPAVLASIVPFAFLHIQLEWKWVAIGSMFIFTALDGAFFCWMFTQWRYNIWVPIWLHILINLSWIAFEGNNSESRIWANVVRLAAIAMSVLFTIWFKKQSGESLRLEG